MPTDPIAPEELPWNLGEVIRILSEIRDDSLTIEEVNGLLEQANTRIIDEIIRNEESIRNEEDAASFDEPEPKGVQYVGHPGLIMPDEDDVVTLKEAFPEIFKPLREF